MYTTVFFVSVTHVKDSLLKNYLFIVLDSVLFFIVPWTWNLTEESEHPEAVGIKVYTNTFACSLLSLSDSLHGSSFTILLHRFFCFRFVNSFMD